MFEISISSLIEFLTDNYPLLFILLGVIIFLFDKKDSKKENSEKKPVSVEPKTHNNKTITLKELNQELKNAYETFKELTSEAEHTDPKKKIEVLKTFTILNEPEKSQEINQELKEKLTRAEEILQKEKKSPQIETVRKANNLTENKQNLIDIPKVNQDNLIQGIIWSEILNEPKSKRIYRTNFYQ